jgi:chemotaxis family two-component system sensor kinase Cph1
MENLAPGYPSVEEYENLKKELENTRNELKRSEQRLQFLSNESAEHLRLIIDTLPALIAYADASEYYIYCNKTYESWIGIPREEIIGKHIRDVVGKEIYDIIAPHIQAAIAGKTIIYEEKIPYKTGDKYVKGTYIPHTRNDDVVGFIILIEDLSKQKKTEEALLASNRELEEIAYIASHDLQEPLRMVGSYVQLLKKRYSASFDKDGLEFIEYASSGAKRMKEMLEGLLDYSRIGRKIKNYTIVDLNNVLENVILRLNRQIIENNAQINFGPLPEIEADEKYIFELFKQLIDNAIKFRASANPVIDIDYEIKDGYYIFSVKDNGLGIEQKFFNKIFIIFQYLNPKNIYPGLGLGLSYCKRIIEHHGGKIWLESEEGKGSTFFFSLPVKSYQEET